MKKTAQKKGRTTINLDYDKVAAVYHKQYQKENLYNTKLEYPANYFRLNILLNSFKKKGIKKVVEVGAGEGTPLMTLGKHGMDPWGFDVSEKMVEKAKENFAKHSFNPDHMSFGDIQNPKSYAKNLKNGAFDGLIAMGVMPHVLDDVKTLKNMAALVKPGGSVFIEFRNKFFSLFTFNRYTAKFILEDLLPDVNPKMRKLVERELAQRLKHDIPELKEKQLDTRIPGKHGSFSKFHNPFQVTELFKELGFKDIELRWYHYHPGMPYLESKDPNLFRKESIALEHETSGWRGMFLCSAFVVEAVKAK